MPEKVSFKVPGENTKPRISLLGGNLGKVM
jgi:hypothetical protein